MAVLLPLYVNGVDYDAEAERRGLSGLVAQSAAGVPRSGVLGPAPAVSLSGATVQVGPFNAVVGTAKGGYLTGVDSVMSAGTLSPADQTNGRLDRVILEVLDPDNGSSAGARGGRLRIVTGAPAALPGLPLLPVNSLHLAQVQVPRSGAGNPVVTVDCPLTAAAGAPVPVRGKAERDLIAPVEGFAVQRLDMGGRVQTYSGGAWRSDPQVTVEGSTSEASLTKYGTVSAASDGNGAAAYIFTEPFPNRILGATLTQVYTSSLGLVDLRYNEALSNRNRVAFFCYDAAGNLLRNLTGIRFTFTAWGD